MREEPQATLLRQPPLWLSLLVCATLVAIWGLVRLVLFPSVVMPLTYALPLLVCIWTRDRRLLLGMAGAFVAMASLKMFVILPDEALSQQHQWAIYVSQVINIAVAVAAVHVILTLRTWLEDKNAALEAANAELEAANEELVAREEEIRQQNEELQSQSEELEQQNEELRTQGEELEQQNEELNAQTEELNAQTEELQTLNEELARRERLLEALLASVGSLASESQALHEVCRHGLSLLGPDVIAAAVIEPQAQALLVHAQVGIEADGQGPLRWPAKRSMTHLVMQENRTASLADGSLRPDVSFPAPSGGGTLRSVLATPLRSGSRAIGAIEFYSSAARPWTDDQFRLAEWVAAQCAMVLETLRLRQELQASDERFRATFERAGVGLAHVGLDGRFLRLNSRLCQITGWSEHELLNKTFQEITHPEDLDADLTQAQRLAAGEIDHYTMEKRYLRPDGSPVWINLTGSAVRGRESRPLYYIAAIEEITQRKRLENRLRRFFDSGMVGAIYWNMDGQITDANDRFLQMIGYDRQDLQSGRINWSQMTPTEYQHMDERALRQLRETGIDQPYEKEFIRKDGTRVPILIGAATLDEQRHDGVAFVLDMTEQQRAREAQRESEERLRLALEAAEMGWWHFDLASGQIHWDDRFATIFGVAEHAMSYDQILTIIHPEDRQRLDEAVRRSLDPALAQPYALEYRVVWPDGSVHWVAAKGQAHFVGRGEQRKAARFIGTVMEITARKLAEQALQEAKQAAEAANHAKDHFLAVLSHELRTPLNPALMAATVIESDPDLPARLREDADVIRRNIELEARLIDDLLDLTRIARGKLILHRRLTDGCEVLRHAIATCHPDITDKRLGLRISMKCQVAHIDADPARLQQVFWNLLKNAIKFTPEGGMITVSADMVPAGGGDRFQVRVSDTGKGIDPEVLPRIFDAFEQGGERITRQYGGMGMGLAICRGLLQLHEGSIRASSRGPGQGSTFTVELPLVHAPTQDVPVAGDGSPRPARAGGLANSAGEQPAPRGRARPARPARAGFRILLVEDHESTARITARLLRGFGHDVKTADNMASALDAFDRHCFDLIISDLGLPDGSGCDLLRELLARARPRGKPVKAIALSGYGMDRDIRNSIEAGFIEHLTKPINTQQLELAIQRAGGSTTHTQADAPGDEGSAVVQEAPSGGWTRAGDAGDDPRAGAAP